MCTSFAAWKRYRHLDLHAAAALKLPITRRTVWAHYADTHHPEARTDGNPLDEKHLLKVAHHWIPCHAQSQTYAHFIRACFEHGWMMKAALANCPDVMPQQQLWACLARRGWHLKDRIGWALMAHQAWYLSLVKHLILEVHIVSASLAHYEKKWWRARSPSHPKRRPAHGLSAAKNKNAPSRANHPHAVVFLVMYPELETHTPSVIGSARAIARAKRRMPQALLPPCAGLLFLWGLVG